MCLNVCYRFGRVVVVFKIIFFDCLFCCFCWLQSNFLLLNNFIEYIEEAQNRKKYKSKQRILKKKRIIKRLDLPNACANFPMNNSRFPSDPVSVRSVVKNYFDRITDSIRFKNTCERSEQKNDYTRTSIEWKKLYISADSRFSGNSSGATENISFRCDDRFKNQRSCHFLLTGT